MVDNVLLPLFWGVVGIILSFAFEWIRRVLKYIKYRRNLGFLGKWYVYHFSTYAKEIIFYEYEWIIGYKKPFYILTADASPRQNGSGISLPEYSGRITIRDGRPVSLDFHMEDHKSKEEFYAFVANTIPNEKAMMYGIKTGVDFNNSEFATIYLFSRNKLEYDVAQRTIKEKTIGVKPFFLKV